jgi:phosphoglycolate phosphatase-like HAD superfamily hydrolase
MTDYVKELKELKPQREFFIGIDSDGCVFDTMEIKHKECFCPAFIKHFRLQAVSSYARDAWNFVSLYSKDRGSNRFHALIKTLNVLGERSVTKARGVNVPHLPALEKWVKEETKLGNPALRAKVKESDDKELKMILAWSEEVNKVIEEVVFGVPPFPGVRESLLAAGEKADLLVVSQTPIDALLREWEEHKIDQYVRCIAGQEAGTKGEHLQFAAAGKYPADKILMIGDAYGDIKAADVVSALFYPVVPGREEESWKRFHDEALPRFFAGTYKGAYEDGLRKELAAALPDVPPWNN